jgi:formamidopyrimidine-DNA glycosylase
MPELPEVETVARGLAAVLPRRRITHVSLGMTDFVENPEALSRNLPGCQIEGVRRYGKYLVLHLAPTNGFGFSGCLLVHLGMTGQFVIEPAEAPLPPHTHVVLTLDDGHRLRYTDVRRFGRLVLVTPENLHARLARLGADPLELSEAEFCARLACRRARVKALLLDQHTLRGLGNIYADESLWHARIHPASPAWQLGRKQLARLYRAVQRVLHEAIGCRGSSISNYRDAAGQMGSYQRRHRVYGREGKPCFRCHTKICRTLVAGRSSYYCPRCQRAPGICSHSTPSVSFIAQRGSSHRARSRTARSVIQDVQPVLP